MLAKFIAKEFGSVFLYIDTSEAYTFFHTDDYYTFGFIKKGNPS